MNKKSFELADAVDVMIYGQPHEVIVSSEQDNRDNNIDGDIWLVLTLEYLSMLQEHLDIAGTPA